MAAIDKIYIKGWNNYCKFRDWVYEQPVLKDKYGTEVKLSVYLWELTKDDWGDLDNARPVMNNPYYVDAYIIRNCPLDFIQEELAVNYGYWTQDRLKLYYEDIKNWPGDKECPYWAKLEDFEFQDDGIIILKGLEKSDYEKILDGELYNKPTTDFEFEPGKHLKYVKSPTVKRNKPMSGSWFIDVDIDGTYVWFHSLKNGKVTCDFRDEFVRTDSWSSNMTNAKTVKAAIRKIRSWNLPIGAKVRLTGRYVGEEYEFIITK